MAHPLVMVNGQEWKKQLGNFSATIALIALAEGTEEKAVDDLIEQYVTAIDSNEETIMLHTAAGITEYCNFYKVLPTEGVHDEFKGLYFTAVAVSVQLTRMGLAELNKLHLRALLRLLDIRLFEPYRANRPLLTARIRSVIDNNAVESHLGKYGWYLTYKCLFNAVNSNSKTI